MTKAAKQYPPFYLTVDIVLMTMRSGQLAVLLVQRKGTPFASQWALPGGFVEHGEEVEAAVRRELAEETGLDAQGEVGRTDPPGSYIEQLKLYGQVGRDPRGRIVSSAWVALYKETDVPVEGSDAAAVRWWPVADLEGEDAPDLAFDHQEILHDGLERVRAKLEYTAIATSFVDEEFTISDLRRVYEAVWGHGLDRIGFHERVMKNEGFVVPAGGRAAAGAGGGRPALLYRRGPKFHLDYPIRRDKEA
jgi:8-oxo-dGTP diphosphatase